MSEYELLKKQADGMRERERQSIIKDLSYSDIITVIRGAQLSYMPALLIEVTKQCYEKGAFKPGGASTIVGKVERDIGKEK